MEALKNVPGLELQTTCGNFSGSMTCPYPVSEFKHGLCVRDVGRQGSLVLALRGDVFDLDGNLYAKTAVNGIKKYSTKDGFIDKANCILSGEIVSNLTLWNGFLYAVLATGFLAKIDCRSMTVVYINLANLVAETFSGVNFLPPKSILFYENYMLFASGNRLFRLELDSEKSSLKSMIFKDAALTETAVIGEKNDFYIVNKRCEIHKIPLSGFDNTAFEANADNTASFYRKGFKLPESMVFAEGALHFRLLSSDEDQKQIVYISLNNFPRGKVYEVTNDTCRAKFVLPTVLEKKVYVCANAYYLLNDDSQTLKCDELANSFCTRSCQKIPAGCDSRLVPPILFYGEGVGKIGHDLYPGVIGFSNQRVSIFQILKVNGKHKLFVITAVYKDYFAARSNDGNVYILARAEKSEKEV